MSENKNLNNVSENNLEEIRETKKAYLEVFRKLKVGKKLSEKIDTTWIFSEYYLPVDQQNYFLSLAEESKFFRDKLKIDKSLEFQKMIDQRVSMDTNMINLISGQTGNGKSVVGIKIMQLAYLSTKKNTNYQMKIRFCFNPLELANSFKKMNDGDFVQCDEWANISGQGSEVLSNQLENILSTVRSTKKSVNLCTPLDVILSGTTNLIIPLGQKKDYLTSYISLKLCKTKIFPEINGILENLFGQNGIYICNKCQRTFKSRTLYLKKCKFCGSFSIIYRRINNLTKKDYELMRLGKYKINYRNMVTRCLWYSVNYNTKGLKKRIFLNGVIYLNVGTVIPLLKDYKKLKDRNYKNLEKNRGGIGAFSKDYYKHIKEQAEKLYIWAFENKGYPKNELNPSKNILDLYVMESGIGNGLGTHDFQTFKNLVVEIALDNIAKRKSEEDKLKKELIEEEDLEEKGIENKDFEYDENEILEYNRKNSNSPNINRNIEIYKKLKNPINTGETIMREYQELNSGASVKKVVDNVKGILNREIGLKYEVYLKPRLQEEYKEVIHNGENGKVDFVLLDYNNQKIFLSVKCLDFERKTTIFYDQSMPEIDKCREYIKTTGKKAIVKVHIYNRFNKKIYTFELSDKIIKSNIKINKKHKKQIKIEEYDK